MSDNLDEVELKPRQLLLIMLLAEHRQLTTSLVAKKIRIGVPDASRLARSLTDLGLAARTVKPTDFRVGIYTLTDQGKTIAARLQPPRKGKTP